MKWPTCFIELVSTHMLHETVAWIIDFMHSSLVAYTTLSGVLFVKQ